MPTERLAALLFGLSVMLAILLGSPVAIPEGWDKALHFCAFSLLTLFLWQASAGQMPRLVVLAAIAFAGFDEWRQAYLPGRVSDAGDFLVDLAAVLATAGLLLKQRKASCAESSPR